MGDLSARLHLARVNGIFGRDLSRKGFLSTVAIASNNHALCSLRGFEQPLFRHSGAFIDYPATFS